MSHCRVSSQNAWALRSFFFRIFSSIVQHPGIVVVDVTILPLSCLRLTGLKEFPSSIISQEKYSSEHILVEALSIPTSVYKNYNADGLSTAIED
ncbi:hypothetical protein Tco_1556472 [Tanacetum coccineum]